MVFVDASDVFHLIIYSCAERMRCDLCVYISAVILNKNYLKKSFLVI